MNWITVILGLWLIIAPFALSYSTHAQPLWNDIILGVVLALFGGYLALQEGKGARMPMTSGGMGHH